MNIFTQVAIYKIFNQIAKDIIDGDKIYYFESSDEIKMAGLILTSNNDILSYDNSNNIYEIYRSIIDNKLRVYPTDKFKYTNIDEFNSNNNVSIEDYVIL